MKAYLTTAPAWVQSALQGIFFGVLFGVFTRLVNDGSWAASLVTAVITGTLFGFFMGKFNRQDRSDTRSELKDLTHEQRRVALRSATRGPAPHDPAVRHAALRCAERSATQMERLKRSSIIIFTVALIAYAVMAVIASPLWWLAFVLFAALLTLQITYPRHLQNRVALLSQSADTAT